MSLTDIKNIDWKHADMKSIPLYLFISAALIIVGIALVIVGMIL